jgi:hypothetical protein
LRLRWFESNPLHQAGGEGFFWVKRFIRGHGRRV